MPIKIISDLQLGNINTTKLLSISSAETLFILESSNRAFEANNIGIHTIFYGDSGVLTHSGGPLVANGAKFWDRVVGGFNMFFVVASGGVTSDLVIHEYAGN